MDTCQRRETLAFFPRFAQFARLRLNRLPPTEINGI